MKSIVLIITTSIILGLNPGFAQNRFENLNADSLEYVIIKYQEEPDNIVIKKITEPEKIKEVLDFLKQTKFENYQPGDDGPILKEYIFLINFGGWRESTYLFKNVAFIGKTQFNIDPKTIDKLKILYKKL